MEYKGAVFFDYDGTLADDHAGIAMPTEKTCEAARLLTQNGYLVVLATGRAKCYIPEVGIPFTGYITTNGAYAEVDGTCVHNAVIDRTVLEEAVAYMDERGIMYALECQDQCYAKDLSDRHFLEVIASFRIDRSMFTIFDPKNPPKANKLFVTHNTADIEDAFSKRFEGKLMMKRHRFCISWDVDIYGMTKAVGMEAVMKALHLKKENVYAFGDGVNDYTMLELAGHGIAMGDHASCLEDVAEFITDSVPGEGVYNALKKMGLI